MLIFRYFVHLDVHIIFYCYFVKEIMYLLLSFYYGIVEVCGSIPHGSTKFRKGLAGNG